MRYIQDIKSLVLNWISSFRENSVMEQSELVNNMQPLPLRAENNDNGIHLKVEKLACSLDSGSENYKQGCNFQATDSFCERCQN